ncbi:VOC family protein [Dongshaea marina]|uniref:VOC family protein n=1 Tax=Dongshaea marina TaxID=2047966 RepID=UPI000D3E6DC2|nr:VOC family protein [Dongshaea marina]
MQQQQTIDYVEFPSRDLETTKAFFSSCFGWQFQDFGPDYCAFTDGKMQGGFYRSKLSSSSETGAALVVLYSDELEKTLQQVEQGGGTICKDIFSFPGGRRFHFQEPGGNNELAVWSDN